MKKWKKALALLAALLLFASCGSPPTPEPEPEPEIVESDFGGAFGEHSGSAVFLRNNTLMVYNPGQANRQISPNSIFDIITSLAIIESGANASEIYTLLSDDTPLSNKEEWSNHLTMEEAFRSHCTWYYRQSMDLIGPRYIQELLNELQYGNCDVGQWQRSEYDAFWLDGSLKVSLLEQVAVLEHIFAGKSSISPGAVAYVREMLLETEVGHDATVYGRADDKWYVGFFETDDDTVYFALHLDELDGTKEGTARNIALEIINTHF